VQCCWNWHKPCSKPESVAAVGRNKRSLHQHLLVSTMWLKLKKHVFLILFMFWGHCGTHGCPKILVDW
jgi:hypothetical protein